MRRDPSRSPTRTTVVDFRILLLLVVAASLPEVALSQCEPPIVAPGDPVPLAFCFSTSADGLAVAYDPVTGEAAFDVEIRIGEFPSSAGYPNDTQAFSIGLRHPPGLVTATSVVPAGSIAALHGGAGPDYFDARLLGSGVTIGAVYSFGSSVTIQFSSIEMVATVTYETVPSTLAGDFAGAFAVLSFDDELGTPPVVNDVVVAGLDVYPETADATVQLVPSVVESPFTRADCNQDGSANLADVITILAWLFEGLPAPGCDDACDTNDDSAVDVADAISMLIWIFSLGPPPPLPFPDCGIDPTEDGLGCSEFSSCP